MPIDHHNVSKHDNRDNNTIHPACTLLSDYTFHNVATYCNRSCIYSYGDIKWTTRPCYRSKKKRKDCYSLMNSKPVRKACFFHTIMEIRFRNLDKYDTVSCFYWSNIVFVRMYLVFPPVPRWRVGQPTWRKKNFLLQNFLAFAFCSSSEEPRADFCFSELCQKKTTAMPIWRKVMWKT